VPESQGVYSVLLYPCPCLVALAITILFALN
jgi:hypothetical protein